MWNKHGPKGSRDRRKRSIETLTYEMLSDVDYAWGKGVSRIAARSGTGGPVGSSNDMSKAPTG